MTVIIFVSLLVVILVALVTTVETAFFTVGRGEIEVALQKDLFGAKLLKELKNSPSKTVVTLVILVNTLVTIGSMVVAFLTTSMLGDAYLGAVSVGLTLLMIMLSEIIPKTIGELYAGAIARYSAKPLVIATYILYPLVWILEHITKLFHRGDRHVSEEELKALSLLGSSQGSIEADEHQIIHNAFRMNDLTAKDVMTPRTVIEFLHIDATLDDERAKLLDTPYSRYPVVDKDIDDVVGFAQTKDLLIGFADGEGSEKISDYTSKPLVIDENMKLDALLSIFQKTRIHLAIVKDQFGGTAGVITLEDVIEQLIGEIVDETDEYADLRQYAEHRQKNNRT